MSGFFFFFLFFFSPVFLSRKNCCSLFSFFFFSFFFPFSLFSGEVRKRREKIYISKEARVFVQREREKNIRTTTYAREVQKERKLSPLLLLPSLFLSLLLFVSRRGTCVISLWQKKGWRNIFGTTKERKKWGKVKKRGGADSAETTQKSPKGEKRFKTLVSTENYL